MEIFELHLADVIAARRNDHGLFAVIFAAGTVASPSASAHELFATFARTGQTMGEIGLDAVLPDAGYFLGELLER